MKRKFKIAPTSIQAASRVGMQPIVAAEDDDMSFDTDFSSEEDTVPNVPEDGSIQDSLDDVADSIDDLQDGLDDVVPENPTIDMNNNIENHMIAECEFCHGIFISAVTRSDADTESIHGTCPLCDKESDQYLKWVILDAKEVKKLGSQNPEGGVTI